MTFDREDKQSLSNARMERAREFIADARANYEQGRYKTSVNRSYYAALSSLRAVLILEGANPSTHEGVITMLSLRMVRPGLIPVKTVKDFKVLLSRRTDVDYGDFETVGSADAEDSIRLAEEIISTIERVRSSL